MFFTARSDGVLDAWDYYLNGQNEPALSTQAGAHSRLRTHRTMHSQQELSGAQCKCRAHASAPGQLG